MRKVLSSVVRRPWLSTATAEILYRRPGSSRSVAVQVALPSEKWPASFLCCLPKVTLTLSKVPCSAVSFTSLSTCTVFPSWGRFVRTRAIGVGEGDGEGDTEGVMSARSVVTADGLAEVDEQAAAAPHSASTPTIAAARRRGDRADDVS